MKEGMREEGKCQMPSQYNTECVISHRPVHMLLSLRKLQNLVCERDNTEFHIWRMLYIKYFNSYDDFSSNRAGSKRIIRLNIPICARGIV